MSDEEAFMLLVLSNAQSELSPLEIGVHALEAVPVAEGGRGKKGGLREYARKIGKSQSYITEMRQAAEVYKAVKTIGQPIVLRDKAPQLDTVHKAPQNTWLLLVQHLLANQWGREDTEAAVKRVEDLLSSIPAWWTVDRQSVASLAIENKAQGLKGVFELAGTLADKLGVVTIYRHEESEVTEIRNGREYRRFDPVAFRLNF